MGIFCVLGEETHSASCQVKIETTSWTYLLPYKYLIQGGQLLCPYWGIHCFLLNQLGSLSGVVRAVWPGHAFTVKIWAQSRDMWRYPQLTSAQKCTVELYIEQPIWDLVSWGFWVPSHCFPAPRRPFLRHIPSSKHPFSIRCLEAVLA